MTAPLAFSDQVVANCVGLLVMPELHADAAWRQVVVGTMHDHLPTTSRAHPYMASLIRAAETAWPREGRPQPTSMEAARRHWVTLQRWRLGEALARAATPSRDNGRAA